MIPIDQARAIVAALDITVSDNEAVRLAERILADNFCWNVIVRAVLVDYAPTVLRSIYPLERNALLERLHVHPGAVRGATPAPLGTATWVVRKNKFSEKPEIVASCAACSQLMTFVPNPAGGSVPQDLKFSHCGKQEECPESLLYGEYQRALQGPSDADRKYEADVFKERNEQIVQEQARKDRALAARLVGPNNIQVAPPPAPPTDALEIVDSVLVKAENVLKSLKGRK
jgi:hypothetical protein